MSEEKISEVLSGKNVSDSLSKEIQSCRVAFILSGKEPDPDSLLKCAQIVKEAQRGERDWGDAVNELLKMGIRLERAVELVERK